MAEHGLARYDDWGWPCGIPGGRTPNLFLGLAGMGYFYLRLVDPKVPSVLMPLPEPFAHEHGT